MINSVKADRAAEVSCPSHSSIISACANPNRLLGNAEIEAIKLCSCSIKYLEQPTHWSN